MTATAELLQSATWPAAIMIPPPPRTIICSASLVLTIQLEVVTSLREELGVAGGEGGAVLEAGAGAEAGGAIPRPMSQIRSKPHPQVVWSSSHLPATRCLG